MSIRYPRWKVTLQKELIKLGHAVKFQIKRLHTDMPRIILEHNALRRKFENLILYVIIKNINSYVNP